MSVDVAVVGAPFLDLTFSGMPRLPGLGEELLADSLHIGPGGSGMQAIGAARLNLSTALVAPIGNGDGAGLVRRMLEAEGVTLIPGQAGERDASLPTTALLSTPEGVAMATALGGDEPTAEDVAAAEAGATVMSIGRLNLAPSNTRVYAVTGTLEIDGADHQTAARLECADAVILNAREALALANAADPEEAAEALGEHARTIVVTLGEQGALAFEDGRIERAPAPNVETVDATGAGDLFVAAYVWADLRGAPLADGLAWATLYAGLSVRSTTALSGALNLDELLYEGEGRGLIPPPSL